MGGRRRVDERDQGEHAALGRRLAAPDFRLEREQAPERLDVGEPADQPSGGRLELERQPQLAVELAVGREHRLTGGHRLRELGGHEARERDADGGLRALRRIARQPQRLLHVACRLGHARRRLGRAELEQRRPCQLGRRLLLERPPQEANRVVGGATGTGAARRFRQRVERPALARRRGAEEVDGRSLAPRRVARELAGSGEMQLRLLGRGDRVRERLLDDRVEEPRRQRTVQQLGVDQLVDRARCRVAVEARDRRGIGERRVVAEDRESAKGRRPRRHPLHQRQRGE